MQRARLLYLGYAFPPGVSAMFPELQPAGHLIETKFIQSLEPRFDRRVVGISEVDLTKLGKVQPTSPGLPHELSLLDRAPALWNWIRSLRKLRRAYAAWLQDGWRPDLILACNFSPVYNAFVRELAQRKKTPALVLYFMDGSTFGRQLPWSKRVRYRLKPFRWLEDEMVGCYDACVAMSRDTEARFAAMQKAWRWHPGGCDPSHARKPLKTDESGPVVFGYFGSLSAYTGIGDLLQAFATSPIKGRLRVCGYGKDRPRLEREFASDGRISFSGPASPEECLEFGSRCDVLVNPRPFAFGNENNFPSKVHQYGMCGCSILTSGFAGVRTVLGPEAFYFDTEEYPRSLGAALRALAELDRGELLRKGLAVQKRLLTNYTWESQARGVTEFLLAQIHPSRLPAERRQTAN